MGDDEIAGAGRCEGERVRMMDIDARRVGFAAVAKELEHLRAAVYSVGMDVGIGSQERSEKAAVSITDNEGAFLIEKERKKVQPAAFEGTAEGEVFEPAIRPGDPVEVRFGAHRGRNRMKRMGVRRTRSAAARRDREERWVRR